MRRGRRRRAREAGRPELLLYSAVRPFAGIGRVFFALQRELGAQGWRVTMAWPGDARLPRSGSDAAREAPGVPFVAGPSSQNARTWDLRPALRLWRLVRHHRRGVISAHFNGSRPVFRDLLAFRLAGARVVATAHGLDVVQPRRRWTMRLRSVLFAVMVVPSPSAREAAIRWGVPARKVAVIPNGVPRIEAVERDAARTAFALPGDAFVVACASRFEKRKRLGDLVEGVARVPGAHLLLAGNPGPRDRIVDRGRELLGDRFHFVGWLSEGVGRLYAAADVFCLPAERESFGLAYLEAAQFGVPSIGCDTPGTRDTIEDGRTGLLVEPGDVEALAAAITRLRDDPELRRRLGEAAREKACLLSEERMARRYAALFRRMAS